MIHKCNVFLVIQNFIFQGKLAFERLDIPKVYHPFLFGPFNETVNQIKNETGARINIPPPSVNKNELTITGEKEAVALAKEKIMNIYEERVSNVLYFCYVYIIVLFIFVEY